MVSLLWYQIVVFLKFPFIIKFLYNAFLYPNLSSVHVILSRYWAHTLINVTVSIDFVHEADLVCNQL